MGIIYYLMQIKRQLTAKIFMSDKWESNISVEVSEETVYTVYQYVLICI